MWQCQLLQPPLAALGAPPCAACCFRGLPQLRCWPQPLTRALRLPSRGLRGCSTAVPRLPRRQLWMPRRPAWKTR